MKKLFSIVSIFFLFIACSGCNIANYSYTSDDYQSNISNNDGVVYTQKLDSLGRTQEVTGIITPLLISSVGKRESISSIHPSGWHQLKTDKVSNGYLYARSHLIAHSLGGPDTEYNLITGTYQLNQTMMKYEEQLRDIVRSGQTIEYTVTPYYEGSNFLASSVGLKADYQGGDNIFDVIIPNEQDGVIIDYATGFASNL